jgi:hypothetical protein
VTDAETPSTAEGVSDGPPNTLADIGVTKKQSSKWQKLAAVPEGAGVL